MRRKICNQSMQHRLFNIKKRLERDNDLIILSSILTDISTLHTANTSNKKRILNTKDILKKIFVKNDTGNILPVLSISKSEIKKFRGKITDYSNRYHIHHNAIYLYLIDNM